MCFLCCNISKYTVDKIVMLSNIPPLIRRISFINANFMEEPKVLVSSIQTYRNRKMVNFLTDDAGVVDYIQ